MTHFAALMQRQESFSNLIGIHERVGTVDQQQVDMIRRQVHQRLLGAFDDVCAVGNVMTKGMFRFCRRGNTAFGDNFHPLTQRRNQLEGFSERGFTRIAAINVSMIDGGDP